MYPIHTRNRMLNESKTLNGSLSQCFGSCFVWSFRNKRSPRFVLKKWKKRRVKKNKSIHTVRGREREAVIGKKVFFPKRTHQTNKRKANQSNWNCKKKINAINSIKKCKKGQAVKQKKNVAAKKAIIRYSKIRAWKWKGCHNDCCSHCPIAFLYINFHNSFVANHIVNFIYIYNRVCCERVWFRVFVCFSSIFFFFFVHSCSHSIVMCWLQLLRSRFVAPVYLYTFFSCVLRVIGSKCCKILH